MGSFLPSLDTTLPKTDRLKPKEVKSELEAIGMRGDRELARLTRLVQADVSTILKSEAKRSESEAQIARIREFERRRAAQVNPDKQRQEGNRQRNESHLKANKKQFQRHLNAVKERREEKERKAREARQLMEEQHAAKTNDAHEAEAIRAQEIEQIRQNGPEGVVISASQMSNRARDELAAVRDAKEKTLETRRQQHDEELASFVKQKRESLDAKVAMIKEKKKQIEEAKLSDSSEAERALKERLAAMRRAHEEKVARQRREEAEKLEQVHSRAIGRVEKKLKMIRSEASTRAERSRTQMEKHKDEVHAKVQRLANERNAAAERNARLLRRQLQEEADKRAETADRMNRQLEMHEQRKAAHDALITSRRLATMQFARLKEDYMEQQHKAQVTFGPTSDDGKKQLENILTSLTIVDAEARQSLPRGSSAHSARHVESSPFEKAEQPGATV